MTTGGRLAARLILLLSLHQGLVNATSKIARGLRAISKDDATKLPANASPAPYTARNSPEAIGMYDYTSGHLNLVAGAENAAFDPKLGHNIADTPVLIDGTVQNSTDPTSSNSTRRLLAVTAAQAAAGGSWAVVANSGSIAVHFVAFTNNQALIMQRPDIPNPNPYLQNPDGTHEIAAFFDMNAYTFTPFHISQSPFCSGHFVLPNGNGLVVGGDNVDLSDPFLTNGFFSVRVIDPFGQTNTLAPNMPTGRWYPSLLTMPDGTIFIAGGVQAEGGGYNGGCNIPDTSIDNPTYIFYNPTTNSVTQDVQFQPLVAAWPINLYPFLTILPFTGSVFIITGATAGAYIVTPTGYTVDATYGIPVNLPIPVNYPQTACMNLMPLSAANNWAPEVMVVGGSSVDCAYGGTPASTYSYRINAAAGANHTPLQETMPAARALGDCVFLPDGTMFCCNGAAIGTGGGGPGYGNLANPTTAGHLYNPAAPVGSRWTAVADSLIPRLYHSISILTQNGDVMVTGSEATVEYRVQIWTPPYLLNGLPRPTIVSAPELIAPGSRFPIQWSGVDTIDRVVISKLPGVTHSTHMDARQLVLACTAVAAGANAGTTTCSAPPDFTVATPGQYLLFILRNGVPSVGQYVQVTMGPPPLPAGTYVIQSVGNAQCQRNDISVSQACGATYLDTWFNDGSGRQVYTLTLPNAGSNSYTIQTSAAGRPGCNNPFVGANACGAGNNPFLQTADDGSGRQRWSIVPAPNTAGQYYLINRGRPGGCGAYLGMLACAANNFQLLFGAGDDATGLMRWTLTSTAANAPLGPANVPPPLPSGTYTLQNVARVAGGAACRSYASVGQACGAVLIDGWYNQDGSGRQIFNVQLLPSGYNSYTITTTAGRPGCVSSFFSMQPCGGNTNPDLFYRDDGSGNQRFSFVPVAGVAGQYNIIAAGRPGCGNYLSLPNCTTNNGGITQFVAGDDGTGVARWVLTRQAPPAAAAATQPIPDGTYQILVSAGRQNCEQYLTGPACNGTLTAPQLVTTGGATTIWRVALVPGTANQYTIASTNRAGCTIYASGSQCAANTNAISFAGADDGTGAQRWTLTAATNNVGVYDIINVARANGNCNQYFSVPGCGATFTDLYNLDDGSGRQQFRFVHA